MSDTTVSPVSSDTPETPKAGANSQSDPRLYTEAEIEKARQQEKDKMYKRLETMQEQVARLESEAVARAEAQEQQQRRLQQEAEEQARVEKERAESEMSAKDLLAAKEVEWQQQLSQVQRQVDEERALRQREMEYAQLMEQRQQIIQQYSDRIAPQLIDLIDGDTVEEMTRSAEDLALRSDQIVAQTQEFMQTQRQQTPTARVTAPSSGENSGSQRPLTPEEIRSMSMSEYAKHRRSLLGGGTDGGKSRGLFG